MKRVFGLLQPGNRSSKSNPIIPESDESKSNMLLYNLPEGYYPDLLRTIDALQSNTLIEIAQRYFDEESFMVVAAG